MKQIIRGIFTILFMLILSGCVHGASLSLDDEQGHQSIISYVFGEDYNYISSDVLFWSLTVVIALEILCWLEFFRRKRKEYRSITAAQHRSDQEAANRIIAEKCELLRLAEIELHSRKASPKYAVLNKLCSEIVDFEEDDALISRVLSAYVKSELDKAKSPGFISNLRKQLPENIRVILLQLENCGNIQPKEIEHIVMLLSGLSGSAIAVISGTSKSNFYTRKSRIVNKLKSIKDIDTTLLLAGLTKTA